MNAKEEVIDILRYIKETSNNDIDHLITAVENAIFDVPTYDEKLFIQLWHQRNPCHDINADSGKDMFYETAFLIFLDFLNYKKPESDGKDDEC